MHTRTLSNDHRDPGPVEDVLRDIYYKDRLVSKLVSMIQCA